MGYIVEDLERLDREFSHRMDEMAGPCLMGFPDSCDSPRLNMLTQNLKQIVVPLRSELPRLSTTYEKLIGKYNKGYRKLEGNWEVKDIIYKFDTDHIYTMVLYNAETDTYDMIQKVVVEELQEKFGYMYNTTKMDSLKVGDVISNDVLYKSTSYDEDMNYCLGKNANVMFVTDPITLEDSIGINEEFANEMQFVEPDTATIPINANDILVNYFGDMENYQGFPNVGETVKDSFICALRRVNYNHLLYDFRADNIQRIKLEDKAFRASPGAMVYDIEVYCNNIEKMPNNMYYEQIRRYYDYNVEYARKITEAATMIKESGSNYTQEVTFLKSKYQHFDDPNYDWNYKEKAFDNIIIQFRLINKLTIQSGYKLVGRYGNKGVISKMFGEHNEENRRINNPTLSENEQVYNSLIYDISEGERSEEQKTRDRKSEDGSKPLNIHIIPKDEMPYTKGGPRIDLVLNSPGSIRRINTGQLEEVGLNFATERIRQHICKLDTLEEKVELVFKFFSLLPNGQYEFLTKYYDSLTEYHDVSGYKIRMMDREAQQAFIDEIEEKGFYIAKTPFSDIHYPVISKIFDEFSDIVVPYDVYIQRFGMEKKLMNKMVIGEMYTYILKQTTSKNFSARSTGRTNKRGLPEKTNLKKMNQAVESNTPVSLSEYYNILSQIDGMTFAEFHLFMRNSPAGRKSLKGIITTAGNPLEMKKLKLTHEYSNVNAQILEAYFMGMGFRMNYVLDKEVRSPKINIIEQFDVLGERIMDFRHTRDDYYKILSMRNKYMGEHIIPETYPGEAKDIAIKRILDLPEIQEMEIYERVCNAFIDRYKDGKSSMIEVGNDQDDEEEEFTSEDKKDQDVSDDNDEE